MEEGGDWSDAEMELLKFPFYWSGAVGVGTKIREGEWKWVETELEMSRPNEDYKLWNRTQADLSRVSNIGFRMFDNEDESGQTIQDFEKKSES